MLLTYRLHREAHRLEVPGGVGGQVAQHVEEDHRTSPTAHPQPDRLRGLDLGASLRLLAEDRVLRIVRVHLIVHLHAEVGLPQGVAGLVQRSPDQGGHLDERDAGRSGIVAAHAKRVEELQYQVAECHEQPGQHHREQSGPAEAVVTPVTRAVPEVRRGGGCRSGGAGLR